MEIGFRWVHRVMAKGTAGLALVRPVYHVRVSLAVLSAVHRWNCTFGRPLIVLGVVLALLLLASCQVGDLGPALSAHLMKLLM